jgi:GntR family phosphonate transport system transcriptional regulator
VTDASEASVTGSLWSGIADALRGEIASGARRPGDRLPTEAALAVRFGVNRHTVRRALAALAGEGLVRSRRGAGAFVAAAPADYAIGGRVSFHRNLLAAGRLPGRRTTLLETRPSTSAEAGALDLAAGDPVHAAEGVSLADGVPVALFSSAFPAAGLPGLPEALRATSSVTAALRACGVPDHRRAWTRITAALATAPEAVLLEVAPGAPLVVSEGLNTDPEGRPVELGRTRFAAERVTLTVGGEGGSVPGTHGGRADRARP